VSGIFIRIKVGVNSLRRSAAHLAAMQVAENRATIFFADAKSLTL
jgi:hypothetical protein